MAQLDPLTEQEKVLAKQLQHILFHDHQGSDKPVPGSYLAAQLATDFEITVTDVRVRKIIQYLRTEKLIPILSNSKGYFWATSVNEMLECAKSLQERIMAMRATYMAYGKMIQNQRKNESNI